MDADAVWRPAEQKELATDAAAEFDADEIEAAARKMRQLTLQPLDTACKFRNRKSEMYYFVAGAPNVKHMHVFDLFELEEGKAAPQRVVASIAHIDFDEDSGAMYVYGADEGGDPKSEMLLAAGDGSGTAATPTKVVNAVSSWWAGCNGAGTCFPFEEVYDGGGNEVKLVCFGSGMLYADGEGEVFVKTVSSIEADGTRLTIKGTDIDWRPPGDVVENVTVCDEADAGRAVQFWQKWKDSGV